jgi:ribosomal protein L32
VSVHVKCDRCGSQEKTSGVMLFAGLTGPGIPTARAELPDGWRRPRIPHEDGSAWDRELCPDCTADLFRFMAGAVLAPDEADECPDCGHVHVGKRCMHRGPAGYCRCVERSSAPAPDLGTGPQPDQVCPDCGYLRHGDPCSDQVPEVGPCGCKLLTPRAQRKELGIDD